MDPKTKKEANEFVKQFYRYKFPDKETVLENPRVLVEHSLLVELYSMMEEKKYLPEGIDFNSFCQIVRMQYEGHEMLWELSQLFNY